MSGQCLREVPAAYIENGLQLVTGAAVDIVGLRGQHKQVGKRTQRVLPQLFHDRQSENVAFQEGDILNPHEAGRLGEVDDDIGGLRRRKGDDIIVLRLRPKAGEVDDAAVLQDWSVQKEHRGACLLLVVLALPRPERVEHLYPAGRQLPFSAIGLVLQAGDIPDRLRTRPPRNTQTSSSMKGGFPARSMT